MKYELVTKDSDESNIFISIFLASSFAFYQAFYEKMNDLNECCWKLGKFTKPIRNHKKMFSIIFWSFLAFFCGTKIFGDIKQLFFVRSGGGGWKG